MKIVEKKKRKLVNQNFEFKYNMYKSNTIHMTKEFEMVEIIE